MATEQKKLKAKDIRQARKAAKQIQSTELGAAESPKEYSVDGLPDKQTVEQILLEEATRAAGHVQGGFAPCGCGHGIPVARAPKPGQTPKILTANDPQSVPTQKEIQSFAKSWAQGKPATFGRFSGVPRKTREPRGRYAMELNGKNPITGEYGVVGGIPWLETCSYAPCNKTETYDDKKQSKIVKFDRCPRCQVRFCSKECHKADHALDKSANCKAIGAKIQDFGARFNQCDKCKAAFAKFLKSAHYYADFEPCSVCIWEPVQPVD